MKNAVSGLGLAPDAAMVTFPIGMFLPGSDITPVRSRDSSSCGIQPESRTASMAAAIAKTMN